MARFASPKRQAERITHSLHSRGEVASIRTAGNYAEGLKLYGEWLSERRVHLDQSTRADALAYLHYRSEQVSQSTLNRDRQAIDAFRTGLLDQTDRLPVLKSELTTVLKSRAYTATQIQMVQAQQSPAYAFATELAAVAGLRAHELLTLQRVSECAPSQRNWDALMHLHQPGNTYTVAGKGGLVRTIRLPYELSERLETLRLSEPQTVTDREIRYTQFYDLPGGNRWSSSFTTASNRALAWSRGGHGLRHSYAQARMRTLTAALQDHGRALQIVSNELGHLRPEITLVYLR